MPDLLDDIVGIYQKKGLTIIPYRLTFECDPAREILDGLDESFHHILIAGGDGTVNYVVNLLLGAGLDIPVSVLATGTANDFATLLGIPSDIRKACKRIVAGEVRRVDVGCVNGQHFVNIFSCGMLSDISQRTPTFFKNTFGRAAYYVSGLTELSKFHRMQLKITSDGGDWEGSSLMFFVFNGRTAGTLPISYLSQIDDGLLDVLIVRGDNPLATIQTIFHYLSRSTGKYPPGMVHIQCSHLVATSPDPDTTDIDGQPGPSFPLEFTCKRGALRVIAPKARK